ncbi:MAG: LamG domain-containing protein, partial [Planctomycetota bacterium]
MRSTVHTAHCLALFCVLLAGSTATALPMMEAGTVASVDQNWQAVSFGQTYDTPPLVFTLTGEANTFPSIVRIRNVTTTGFEVAQKEAPNFNHGNPAASDGATTPDDVPYFVIEPGSHTVGGIQIDAGRVTTTESQSKGPKTGWESIAYGPFSSDPALVVSTQTMNNTDPADGNQEDPTLPFLATAVNKGSVDGDSAQVALERGEAQGGGSIVTGETIAWLAATPDATASFVTLSGTEVLVETLHTAYNINGWGQEGADGQTFNWASAFTAPPIAVGSDMSRDGNDGGWVRQRLLTASQIGLAIDEDHFQDTERNHTDELAGVLAVSEPFVFAPPPELTWDDSVNNLWSDAGHWLGPPPPSPQVPDTTTLAIINDGEPHVDTTDAATRVLEFNDGTLVLEPASQLTVGQRLEGAAAATIEMGAGSTLLVGKESTIGTLRTNGDATVGGAGDLTVSGATFDGGGATGTFTKTGPGTLLLDNSDGTGVIGVQNLTFDVHEGTLRGVGAQPLGGTAPTTGVPQEVILSGGKLAVEGAAGGGPIPGGATAHWALDGDASDGTGNGNTGTLEGDARFVADGRIGGALTLDGSGDRVRVNTVDVSFDSFSLSIWAKRQEGATGREILMAQGSSGSAYNAMHFGYNNDAQMLFNFYTDDLWVGQPAGLDFNDGEWHHIAGTFDNTPGSMARRFYYDGVEIASKTGGNIGDFVGAPPFWIGRQGYDARGHFNGLLDEATVYERVITPAEVQQLFSRGAIGGIDMTGTPLTVTADSALEATTDGTAAFGDLTFENNSTLTTTGADMSFTRIAVAGPAGRSGTLANHNDITMDNYDDGGTTTTFGKAGGGTLTLDNSGGGLSAAATTFEVHEGRME